MKQVKRMFTKSKVLLLTFALVGGSTALLASGIYTAQAAQEDQVAVPQTSPAVILETASEEEAPAAPAQRNFTIVDPDPVPESKKDQAASPTDKDITLEAAADKLAAKITELTGENLQGYTAELQLLLVKERSTWQGVFTSADQKTKYISRVDSVTGEVWGIVRVVSGQPSEELYNNTTAVFGFDLWEGSI